MGIITYRFELMSLFIKYSAIRPVHQTALEPSMIAIPLIFVARCMCQDQFCYF